MSNNSHRDYINSTIANHSLGNYAQPFVPNGNKHRVWACIIPETVKDKTSKIAIRMMYDDNGELLTECLPDKDDGDGILTMTQKFGNKMGTNKWNQEGKTQRG